MSSSLREEEFSDRSRSSSSSRSRSSDRSLDREAHEDWKAELRYRAEHRNELYRDESEHSRDGSEHSRTPHSYAGAKDDRYRTNGRSADRIDRSAERIYRSADRINRSTDRIYRSAERIYRSTDRNDRIKDRNDRSTDRNDRSKYNIIMCFRCAELGHSTDECLTFKIKLCKHYMNGWCILDDGRNHCSYAHGEAELRKPWLKKCVRVWSKKNGDAHVGGCGKVGHTYTECSQH